VAVDFAKRRAPRSAPPGDRRAACRGIASLPGASALPPCWPGPARRCRVTGGWRARTGQPCMAPSIPVPRRLPRPPRWPRRCAGSRKLGGLVGCRRADHPGAETLWRGLQHLSDLTRMYRMMRPVPP
jgi:hypothetical protein